LYQPNKISTKRAARSEIQLPRASESITATVPARAAASKTNFCFDLMIFTRQITGATTTGVKAETIQAISVGVRRKAGTRAKIWLWVPSISSSVPVPKKARFVGKSKAYCDNATIPVKRRPNATPITN
jgi:hypothetical protein